MEDKIKDFNIYPLRVLENRENGVATVSKEKMTKNFPEWMRYTNDK